MNFIWYCVTWSICTIKWQLISFCFTFRFFFFSVPFCIFWKGVIHTIIAVNVVVITSNLFLLQWSCYRFLSLQLCVTSCGFSVSIKETESINIMPLLSNKGGERKEKVQKDGKSARKMKKYCRNDSKWMAVIISQHPDIKFDVITHRFQLRRGLDKFNCSLRFETIASFCTSTGILLPLLGLLDRLALDPDSTDLEVGFYASQIQTRFS